MTSTTPDLVAKLRQVANQGNAADCRAQCRVAAEYIESLQADHAATVALLQSQLSAAIDNANMLVSEHAATVARLEAEREAHGIAIRNQNVLAAELETLRTQLAAAEARDNRLKTILVDAINAGLGHAASTVSDDFVAYVPEEVRLMKAKLAAAERELSEVRGYARGVANCCPHLPAGEHACILAALSSEPGGVESAQCTCTPMNSRNCVIHGE